MAKAIVDKNRKPLAAGQLVRVRFCDGPYGQTQTVEGTVAEIDQHGGAYLVLTTPAVQRGRTHNEYRKPGDRFHVCLPGKWEGDAYVCDMTHNDVEHGHHAWVEIIG